MSAPLPPSRPRPRWRVRVRGLLGPALLAPALLVACGTVPAAAPAPATSVSSPAASGSAPATATPTAAAPTSGGVPSSPAAGRGTCDYTVTGQASKPVHPPTGTGVPTSGTVTFVMSMTEGKVALTLDRNRAPCTVHSFESLVDQGFYNGTRCHRLTDSGIFVLQCGDPTGSGSGGPGYTFADETDGTETYGPGTVAMANAGPNTNGSQFFLVWDDSPLPPDYTVFGSLDKASRDVVAGIASQGQDGSNPAGGGKPNSPAQITSVARG